MMQRYRFVGSFTEIGDRLFSKFGQVADWDDEFYRKDILPIAPFIPHVDFCALNLTQDDLDRYGNYSDRGLATDSFNAKVKQAVLLLIDLRKQLKVRSSSEELVAQPEPEFEPAPELEPEPEVVAEHEDPEEPIDAVPENDNEEV